MTTAPFDPAVAQLVTFPHYETLSAVAVVGVTQYPLDVQDYTIDLDEARSPRVRSTLVCAVPEAQATLDALDPRTLVKVRISVSYRLPSGTLDTQQLFELHLRDRTVRRPDNTMTLQLASKEALIVDAAQAFSPYKDGGVLLHDSCVAFISQTVSMLFLDTPMAADTIIVTTPAGPEFTYDAFPSDWWDGIRDALDLMDANLYDEGDGQLRLAPRRYVTADATVVLNVGETGTITGSETGVSRDEWANDVQILWTWDNSANTALPDRRWGQAWVASGPFAQTSAGLKRVVENRSGRINVGLADPIARNVLRRLLARARTYQIDAVPAWWLRPEDTVTIQLPTGNQERHIVSSVTFTRTNGMSVITRLPDNQSVISGE